MPGPAVNALDFLRVAKGGREVVLPSAAALLQPALLHVILVTIVANLQKSKFAQVDRIVWLTANEAAKS
jgi:hypothetical protein